MHSWTYDAPTGVYKNHTLSTELRHAAIASCKFMQFVNVEPGYGKKKGESITMTRVSNMSVPTNARLSESSRIPEDNVSLSTVSITVAEWGRAVPYTDLAVQLSSFNLEDAIQKALKDQMTLVVDGACAAAFKTCKVKAIPSGVAALTFDTDGTASTTASANLNTYHVEEIRDYLFGTLNCPPYEGDDYVGLVTTKGKRGIMRDPNFQDWTKYTSPEKKYNSEIGKLENIRWVEINNFNALSNGVGTSSVLGEAVVFGADAVVMAVAEDPELRAGIPGDFGRQKAVAWYGIMEFGVVWDTANAGEARIVHVTSA